MLWATELALDVVIPLTMRASDRPGNGFKMMVFANT
jgi:hypothetical protein